MLPKLIVAGVNHSPQLLATADWLGGGHTTPVRPIRILSRKISPFLWVKAVDSVGAAFLIPGQKKSEKRMT